MFPGSQITETNCISRETFFKSMKKIRILNLRAVQFTFIYNILTNFENNQTRGGKYDPNNNKLGAKILVKPAKFKKISY